MILRSLSHSDSFVHKSRPIGLGFLICYLCSVVLIHSQPITTGAKSYDRTFRLLAAVGSYHDIKYDLKTPGETTKVITVAINQAVSDLYPRPTGSEIELYRDIPPPPDAPPGTKPKRMTVLQATLPSSANECIIIVSPTSTDRKAPLNHQVLLYDRKSHSPGSIQLANFSSTAAAVAINDMTVSLAAGESKMVPSGVNKGGRILFQTAIEKGGRFIPAFRGERRLSPNVHGFVFIFDYMTDPDYGVDVMPPPALTKLIFLPSPEALQAKLKRKREAEQAAKEKAAANRVNY